MPKFVFARAHVMNGRAYASGDAADHLDAADRAHLEKLRIISEHKPQKTPAKADKPAQKGGN